MAARIITAVFVSLIAISLAVPMPGSAQSPSKTFSGPMEVRKEVPKFTFDFVIKLKSPTVKKGKSAGVAVIASATSSRGGKTPLKNYLISISVWPSRFQAPDPDGSSTRTGRTNDKGVFSASFPTNETGRHTVEATMYWGKDNSLKKTKKTTLRVIP